MSESRLKIMLVDQDAGRGAILRQALSDAGHHVRIAGRAPQPEAIFRPGSRTWCVTITALQGGSCCVDPPPSKDSPILQWRLR